MKKIILLIALIFWALPSHAQCAMCRAALESSDGSIKPEAVNDGIMYLMVFPYLLVALVGYAVYRLRKKKKLQQKEQL
ncbi:MAG: hypothetical protein EOO45_20380 [Flavobacterium sp.]|nr:MAG: hypothetical protein EOO45_20380 [Flavobacterium sp.]